MAAVTIGFASGWVLRGDKDGGTPCRSLSPNSRSLDSGPAVRGGGGSFPPGGFQLCELGADCLYLEIEADARGGHRDSSRRLDQQT